MIRGIDHLVIATPDPDAAARELEERVGLRCTGGGRHEGSGTRNRLAWLADGSYLELIGVDDPDLARVTPVGRAVLRTIESHGSGLATYALRVDDVGATVTTLAAAGSTFGAPQAGSRRRDDGELVEWRAAFPAADLGPAAPFLIEHVATGAEWGPAAMEERARFAHPIGSPATLTRLDIATADPPSAAAALHDELGLDLWTVADLAVTDIGPHILRFVPAREMPVPAVVTVGAHVDGPRTADVLGLRFDVERVEILVPVEG